MWWKQFAAKYEFVNKNKTLASKRVIRSYEGRSKSLGRLGLQLKVMKICFISQLGTKTPLKRGTLYTKTMYRLKGISVKLCTEQVWRKTVKCETHNPWFSNTGVGFKFKLTVFRDGVVSIRPEEILPRVNVFNNLLFMLQYFKYFLENKTFNN